MMTDKDLTDDVLDEIIAGAKTSLEQYLALSLKAERAANRQQNAQQNIPNNIPGGLIEAVNDLLNNDGSRGRYSAIGCGNAREKIELWLAQRQKWESQRDKNISAGNSPVIPDGWISCSERMPDNDESKPIAIFTGKCLGQGMFVATYDDDGFFDYWEGMEIIGVTHWMPLPEPPQK